MDGWIKVVQIIYLAYYSYYLVKFGSDEGPEKEETKWFVISSLMSLVLNVIYFTIKRKQKNKP